MLRQIVPGYWSMIAMIGVICFAEPVRAQKLYWSEADRIRRANLDGTEVEDLVVGRSGAGPIAVDVPGGKMYWAEWGGIFNSVLRRADFSGQNIETLLNEGVAGIALDPSSKLLYSSLPSPKGGEIRRSSLDGSAAETIVFPVLELGGIALNTIEGKLYWHEYERVRKANLDGSDAEDVVVTTSTNPAGLALDLFHRKVYWSDLDNDAIWRANLDGTDAEPVVEGLGNAFYIAVDPFRDMLIWTEAEYGWIRTSKLDGSSPQPGLLDGLNVPVGIALDSGPPIPAISTVGVVLFAALLLAIGARTIRRRQKTVVMLYQSTCLVIFPLAILHGCAR